MDYKFLFLTTEGRIGRKSWWIGYLYLLLFYIIISLLFFVNIEIINIVVYIFILASIYPYVVLSMKRCHDRNRSGWFLLVGLIPLIGGIWLLIELGCLLGTNGANRFGPDPLTSPEPLTKH